MHGRDYIKAQTFPTQPGVYQMIAKDGAILYIGKAKNLQNRLRNYTNLDLPYRLLRMVAQITHIEIITTSSEAEALIMEASLINKNQPKYNILLKDSKSFPYIKLRLDHDFPQIVKYRGKKLKQGKFFGPYASAGDVNRIVNDLQKIFKIRSCSDSYFSNRQRPCLQYQIKRCSAPCVGKISQADYAITIKQLEQFLTGKNVELQDSLAAEMVRFSTAMQYEKAAEIRDRIKALSYIQSKAMSSDYGVSDADVIAIAAEQDEYCVEVMMIRAGQAYGKKSYFPKNTQDSNPAEILASFIGLFYQTRPICQQILVNESINNKELLTKALSELANKKITITQPKIKSPKMRLVNLMSDNAKTSLHHKLHKSLANKNMLTEMQELFGLDNMPERIEVYDNSHISGKYAVGAMIVATEDGFDKAEYRIFNIKHNLHDLANIKGGDDYAMLREVLQRRIARIKKSPQNKPDFMIIDGGKGHMNTAKQVFDELDIELAFACMSKGVDRNAGRETFHIPGRASFTLDKNDQLMKYLQILRDEAHNHAISAHRKKRGAALRGSELDKIAGIGKIRKNILLNYFGSIERIKAASIDELAKIQTISPNTAKKIYMALHAEG